jgi:hypothetical protein
MNEDWFLQENAEVKFYIGLPGYFTLTCLIFNLCLDENNYVELGLVI